MAINEKYSYKSLKKRSFLSVDPEEFNNSEIIGSTFCQSEPFTDVFPADIEGVLFTRCNLDNCNIPAGATVNGGCHRHIKTQNDGEYWIVDSQLQPIAPAAPERFTACGLSVDPADIPVAPVDEPITITNDPNRIEQRQINELFNNRERVLSLIALEAEAADPVGIVGEV